jgi:hypothetical protein
LSLHANCNGWGEKKKKIKEALLGWKRRVAGGILGGVGKSDV